MNRADRLLLVIPVMWVFSFRSLAGLGPLRRIFALALHLTWGGWWANMGIAVAAIHARACLPSLNCATFSSWHSAQVSGVGMAASCASSIFWCLSPWQVEQSTSSAMAPD